MRLVRAALFQLIRSFGALFIVGALLTAGLAAATDRGIRGRPADAVVTAEITATTTCAPSITLTYDVSFDLLDSRYELTAAHATGLTSDCAGMRLEFSFDDATHTSLATGSGVVPSEGGSVTIDVVPDAPASEVVYVSFAEPVPDETVAAEVWITGGDGREGSADDDGGGADLTVLISLPSTVSASNVDPATIRLCKAATATPVCGDASVAPLTTSVRNDGTMQARFPRKDTLAMLSDVPGGTYVALAVSGQVSTPNVNFVGTDDFRMPR